MSKNPFVNCKSRKRRKVRIPISKPKVKLYCPRTMVRYDDSVSEYKTMWVCKMCLVTVLSPEAVKQHLIKCNAVAYKTKPTPVKKIEDTRYICEFCNKVFSRRVTLKKHLEEHEKLSSSVDSERSDNEIEAGSLITDDANDNNYKPEDDLYYNTDLI